MKKTIFTSLVVLSVILLVARFAFGPVTKMLGFSAKAGLKVTSTPSATVFLDGKEVGQTPYQNENLEVKEYPLRLVSEKGTWQGAAKLSKGTLSVVNREITESITSSSGEALTLVEGQGVLIVSSPTDAVVEIDGQNYGQTPLSIANLAPGEHTFMLSHSNYLKRSIRASLPAKMQLKLEIDLAITEPDLTTTNNPPVVTVTPTTLGKVIVKETPNGFLRVRKTPSTSGAEVTRVETGDSLEVVEELTGWFKIKLEDGKEGYVSASYVSKE